MSHLIESIVEAVLHLEEVCAEVRTFGVLGGWPFI